MILDFFSFISVLFQVTICLLPTHCMMVMPRSNIYNVVFLDCPFTKSNNVEKYFRRSKLFYICLVVSWQSVFLWHQMHNKDIGRCKFIVYHLVTSSSTPRLVARLDIAAMPSLLCSLQILVGWELEQSIPTVVHTVPELLLCTKGIE